VSPLRSAHWTHNCLGGHDTPVTLPKNLVSAYTTHCSLTAIKITAHTHALTPDILCHDHTTSESRHARSISIRLLHPLPRVHSEPIYLVVSQEPSEGVATPGRSHLEGGFPLRCFQRFSRPHVATQPCSWRNNWCTSGVSIPVLSY
jgi:hypothetical protein